VKHARLGGRRLDDLHLALFPLGMTAADGRRSTTTVSLLSIEDGAVCHGGIQLGEAPETVPPDDGQRVELIDGHEDIRRGDLATQPVNSTRSCD